MATTKPSRYVLAKRDPMTAMYEINGLTGGVLPADYYKSMAYTIFMRGGSTTGSLPAPVTRIARSVIGFKGAYFRYTTQNCAVDLIWHDRVTDRFVFYGPYMNVVRAMNVINHRIRLWTERDAAATSGPPQSESGTVESHTARSESCTQAAESTIPDEEEKPSCHYCLTQPDKKMPKCGQCQVARYCDTTCQAAAWKSHKKECNGVGEVD